jgi:hypothetical protein
MDGNRRDELDVLVERALNNCVSDEVPPQRVWTNIRLGLRERTERGQSGRGRVRQLWMDAWSWGSDVLLSTRILLTPAVNGGDNRWTERLVMAVPSSASIELLIHH